MTEEPSSLLTLGMIVKAIREITMFTLPYARRSSNLT